MRFSLSAVGEALRILLVTNLYPHQELGGYGRCMSDFCWGLQQRGHRVSVLCSDAPYLGPSTDGPNGEPVRRTLRLKGSFHNGITEEQDPDLRACINHENQCLLQAYRRKLPFGPCRIVDSAVTSAAESSASRMPLAACEWTAAKPRRQDHQGVPPLHR